jgi:7-keto-8-aminopelargonate synthetase-like enzyme
MVLKILFYMQQLLMQTEVFEPVFGEGDAIISDSLNHASIIDGVVCVRHVTVMQIVTWKI